MRIALVVALVLVALVIVLVLRRRKKKKVEDYTVLRGENLDRVAWGLYGFERKPKETDDELRERLKSIWRNR